MLMKDLAREFEFDCSVRELTERTIGNYTKQIGYFIKFLEREYAIDALEDVQSIHIKSFINAYQKKKCKPSYINDLLKAVKCLCRYAFNEQYTPALLIEKIKNVREPKILIHTFSEKEISDLINYYKSFKYMYSVIE